MIGNDQDEDDLYDLQQNKPSKVWISIIHVGNMPFYEWFAVCNEAIRERHKAPDAALMNKSVQFTDEQTLDEFLGRHWPLKKFWKASLIEKVKLANEALTIIEIKGARTQVCDFKLPQEVNGKWVWPEGSISERNNS